MVICKVEIYLEQFIEKMRIMCFCRKYESKKICNSLSIMETFISKSNSSFFGLQII
jgi:hypothetical protein